jgi:hypothetical protein
MAGNKDEIIIPSTPQPTPDQFARDKQNLLKRIRDGASWFYWIAGASVVNTIIVLFDSDWFFMAGLAFPVIVTAVAQEIGELVPVISLIVASMCAGAFIVFGVFAGKKQTWAFIVGIILYVLDGILFIIFEDWLSAAFHVFATVMIIMGLSANLKLNELEKNIANLPPNPIQMPPLK